MSDLDAIRTRREALEIESSWQEYVVNLRRSAEDVPALLTRVEELEGQVIDWRARCSTEASTAVTYCSERNEARKRVEELERLYHEQLDLLGEWQTASGLEDGSGDPGGIEPEHLSLYVQKVERERDEARAELAEAVEALRALTQTADGSREWGNVANLVDHARRIVAKHSEGK